MNTERHYSEREKNLITITVMMVTVLEILDMIIVNVALPQMMGSLDASPIQITWVLTSYVVCAAMVMPLTGTLIERLGRKRLLIVNIVGFTITSMLCGLSQNLPQIVLARCLQGIFGASLVPLSQFILNDTFPVHERGKAMAIWGVGIMSAPILGPVIGGYITETLNWRWIFYINLPVCLISLWMAKRYIQETAVVRSPVDWFGLVTMLTATGLLQVVLDLGEHRDWFASSLITVSTGISAICWVLFITHSLRHPNPMANLRLFADRNFSLSTLLLALFGINIFGILTIQPLMLGKLLHFSPFQSGLIMIPRGIASAFAMIFCGSMLGRIDARFFVFWGTIFSAWGTYYLATHNLQTDYMITLIFPNILQGIGMGLFFVPLSTMAFENLPASELGNASGIFNYARNLGISIGISLLTNIISRSTQVNWQELGAHVTASHIQLATMHEPLNKVVAQLGGLVYQQANMIGYLNAYQFCIYGFLVLLPMLFLLKKPRPNNSGAAMAH